MFFLPTWSSDFHSLPASSLVEKAGALSPNSRAERLDAMARVKLARRSEMDFIDCFVIWINNRVIVRREVFWQIVFVVAVI